MANYSHDCAPMQMKSSKWHFFIKRGKTFTFFPKSIILCCYKNLCKALATEREMLYLWSARVWDRHAGKKQCGVFSTAST